MSAPADIFAERDAHARLVGGQHADAIRSGAECWRCDLVNSGRGPVPPSLPSGEISLLVIAEAPGATEVAEGKTLCGASGREVRTALRTAGADPQHVGFTNSVLCQPPGDMKRYLQQIKKQGLASPIECCRPRLQDEIARSRFVILMGAASLQAVGISGSITKLRGTPVQIPNGPPALPILHAAFVMRESGRVQRPLFHADVAKAVRLSRGGNTWVDPPYFVPKNAQEVYNFLAVPRERVATDVETDGKDAWTCRLRRIGIGTDREVMIYAPLSVRGHLLMHEHEIELCRRVIADYFKTGVHMALHNGIAFDSIVLHNHGMPIRDDTVLDTMVAHQIGPTSELPHRLDFLGSMYTDAPFWKDDVKHSELKDDEILNRYLSYDIAVTYLSEPYVTQNVTWAQQEHIYNLDAELFRVGRSMAALGIWIDPARRWKFAAEYQEKADRLRGEFVAVAGRDINPGSPVQIRKLLYQDIGLPMLDEHITASGDASTDEPTLLDLLALGLDERARKVIHALLGYREAEKLLGTNTGHIVNGQLVGGPPVHADGRVRTGWRPGKRSGRWGSSDPINLQNVPKKLRAMFCAAPGNKFVAADMSAVELRQIALLAGDEQLIEAFKAFDEKRGPDVHVFNACSLFRCKPEDVNDEVRRFVKCVALGSRVAVPKRGLIRIEELRTPGRVLTEHGSRVASAWHDVGEADCVTVRTSRGLALTVAKHHRLQRLDGSWCWADELKPRDVLNLVLPTTCIATGYARVPVNPWVTRARKKAFEIELPQGIKGLPEVVIEENMAYLLGTILGDGGLCPTGSYVVGLIDDGVIAEAHKCAVALGLPTYYQKRKDAVDGSEFGRLNINSINWRRFLVRLGLHDGISKVLRVPDVIFKSPRAVIISFLAGMFDTDGTVGELSICSKLADFVSDIAMLLGMLGLHGSFHESWNKTYKRFYYVLRLRRHAISQLIAMGGMRAPGKLARQRAKMGPHWGDRAQPLELDAVVIRVEDAGKYRVYDLTVPSTNSYVANCLVNHNSFVYALSYDAQPPTIYRTLSLLRNDNLEPLFPHITLAEVERVYNLWWKTHPAIPEWKKKLIFGWRSSGFIATAYHKRKRYFIGGEKKEEMGNHPIQGASADMQNDAVRGLVAAYPFDYTNHRGLVVQGHDQLVVECGAHEVERVKQIVEHVMQKRIGPMLFPTVAKAADDWKAAS